MLLLYITQLKTAISVEKLGSDNPRIDGRVRNEQDVEVKTIDIPTHNFSIATLGCLILWLGWFGFNPGSTMKADPNAIAHIIMTTNMAASTGGIAATITSWVYFGKPNLSMILNGVLAGLVSITASCAFVNVFCAAVIGLVAGTIVVFSVVFIDRLRIDDPVGAISVHLVCGIWGTLAVGLFSAGPLGYSHWYQGSGPKPGLLVGGGLNQLSTQLVGVLAVGAFTAVFSWFAWSVIKATVGLRVELKAELDGLDVSDHGAPAYGGFVVEQDAPEIAIRSLQANQRPPSPRN